VSLKTAKFLEKHVKYSPSLGYRGWVKNDQKEFLEMPNWRQILIIDFTIYYKAF